MIGTYRIKTNVILKVLGWTVLLFSMLCSYSVFTPSSHSWLVSNDAVTVQFIHDDLIAGPGKLKDWQFPVAPSLFPDLTLYSIVQLLHLRFTISVVIYAILQMIIISLLGIYIFEKIVPPRLKTYSWLIPCLFSIIFMEAYYFSREIIMNQILTSCYYHAGAFVNCLIAYAVFLNKWPKIIKYIFFSLFSAIAVFNDMLYLVMFAVPFVISALFTINKTNLRHIIFCVISVGVGTVAGLKGYQYIKHNGITHFLEPENVKEFSNIIPALNVFMGQMSIYIQQLGFRSFHILFTFISLPVAAVLYLLKRKSFSQELNFFLVFLIVFSFAVLGAPIIAGNYTGYDNIRYNAACFYFSIITLSFFTAYLIEFKISQLRIKKIVSVSLLLLMLILVLAKFSPAGLRNYADYYPDLARKVDSLSEKYQIKRGISQHMFSKVVTLFSKRKVEVLAAYGDASIANMLSNASWYDNKDFDFVILDKGMIVDPSKVLSITDTLLKTGYTILRVKKFHYPNGSWVPVTK